MQWSSANFVFALALFHSSAAVAADLYFTGTTTANGTLIRDTLRHIQLITKAQYDCEYPDGVEAEIVSSDAVPPDFVQDIADIAGDAETTYERWLLSVCGEMVPFLVGFWTPSQGGAMFAVREQAETEIDTNAEQAF